MQLEEIRALVAEDMRQVDEVIAAQFGSDISMIQELSQHIFGGGGKRIRPMLVLLAAKACAYAGRHHVDLAAIVELIHTATLLHDDVVDKSSLRRGKKTANVIWGADASVLVGDFLYSRAFQLMVKIENMSVMTILANASNTIAAGEVMQLVNCKNPYISETQYMETIRRKTATLFEAAAQLGAVIAAADASVAQALADYGRHLGMAFQLADDALDYGASKQDIGKNIGDDLAEGKPTLPLLYVLENGNPEQKQWVEIAIREAKTDHIAEILQAVHNTGALDYTYQKAREQVALAIDALRMIPMTPYHQGLTRLAEFAAARCY